MADPTDQNANMPKITTVEEVGTPDPANTNLPSDLYEGDDHPDADDD